MKKYLILIFVVAILLVIAARVPVALQSYPDFFLTGPHSSLESFFSWSPENFGGNISGEVWRLFPLGTFFYFFLDILHSQYGFGILIVSLLAVSGYFQFLFLKSLANLKNELIKPTAAGIGAVFFVLNTYSVIQLDNSFLLVVSYLVLPAQLWLLLRALVAERKGKYIVALAIINSFTFGTNLIFAVISVGIMLALGLWAVLGAKAAKSSTLFRTLGYSLGLTILLSAYWVVPQIYTALTDRATTQSILQSEDFYNLDSSPAKVLRGLGEWSFFSGNNGVAYNEFAVIYKNNPLVIFATYSAYIFTLLVVIFFRRFSPSSRKILGFWLGLLLFLVPVIGGTNSAWPTSRFMSWVFAHVPYMMAFRNTFKFASLEMLSLSVVIAFGLNRFIDIINRRASAKLSIAAVTVASLLFICLNALPFFNGQLFSTRTQASKVPAYWKDAAAYINKTISGGRIALFPNQYFEVLKWPDGTKSFPRNIEATLFAPPVVSAGCKGCGQYYTERFLTYFYANLGRENIYKLAGFMGITHILQRNDYDYKYYGVQSPEEIKKLTAQPELALAQSFGLLDLYELSKDVVYPLIYSPSRVTATGKLDEIPDVLASSSSGQHQAISLIDQVSGDDKNTLVSSDYYKRIFDIDEVKVESGHAITAINVPRTDSYTFKPASKKTTSSLSYRVGYNYSGGEVHLILQPVQNEISIDGKPLNTSQPSADASTLDLGNYGAESIAVALGGRAFLLSPNGSEPNIGTVTLDIQNSQAVVYKIQGNTTPNLASNGSFEQGLWQPTATNCRHQNDAADISEKLIRNDATDGKNSLQLTASDDASCSYSPELKNFTPGIYYFIFDTKNIAGAAPAYCVWDGRGCTEYSALPSDRNWHNTSQVADLSKDASNFSLYLYAQKGNFEKTVNQYDNVQVMKLNKADKTVPLRLNSSEFPPKDINISNGPHKIGVALEGEKENLIDNGDFNGGLWARQVSDCTDSTSRNGIAMRLAKEPGHGNLLELDSTGDSACVSTDSMHQFSRLNSYLLTFDYKIKSGKSARVCVWDGSHCLIDKKYQSADKGWHTASEVIMPSTESQAPSIFFYANGGIGHEIIRYDNVSVRLLENSFLSTYSLSLTNPKIVENLDVVGYGRINPTLYIAEYKGAKGLLIFQQSFSPGWRAYITSVKPKGPLDNIRRQLGMWPQKQIPATSHIIANGLMNGWWVDGANYTGSKFIIVEYWPQRLVVWGMILGVGTLAIITVILFGERLRDSGLVRRHKKARPR